MAELSIRLKVLALFAAQPNISLRTDQITESLHDCPKVQIRSAINKLKAKGLIEQTGYRLYRLASRDVSSEQKTVIKGQAYSFAYQLRAYFKKYQNRDITRDELDKVFSSTCTTTLESNLTHLQKQGFIERVAMGRWRLCPEILPLEVRERLKELQRLNALHEERLQKLADYKEEIADLTREHARFKNKLENTQRLIAKINASVSSKARNDR